MPNATTTAAAVQFTIGNSYSRAVSAAPQSIPTNVDAKGSSSMTGEESKKIRVRSQINPQRFQIHKGQPFIVTSKDLQSIVDSVNADLKVSTSVAKPQVPLPVRIKKENELKELLRQKSKAKASEWQDTLINIRRRKLKEHQERQEREEAERQRVDREFAEEEQRRRDQAVKRAQGIMYNQEDHVKVINSEILYDLVQQERDAQLALKQQQLKQMEKINQQWHHLKEEQAKKQLEREHREKDHSERMHQELAHHHREEYLRLQREKDESVRRKLEEGKLIMQSDNLFQDQSAVKQEKERQQQRELFSTLQQMVDEKHKRDQVHVDAEKQQQEEIRRWAEKRNRLDQLRKEAESRYLNEKIRIRDQIGNNVWHKLEKERNAKNDWVELRIKETQQREAGKEAARRAREAALKSDMEESIKNTAAKLAERERQRKEYNQQVDNENIATRARLQKEEYDKHQRLLEKERARFAHHKEQIELKRRLKQEAKQDRDRFNQEKSEQEANEVTTLRQYVETILSEPWMQSNPRAKTAEQYELRAWHPLK